MLVTMSRCLRQNLPVGNIFGNCHFLHLNFYYRFLHLKNTDLKRRGDFGIFANIVKSGDFGIFKTNTKLVSSKELTPN